MPLPRTRRNMRRQIPQKMQKDFLGREARSGILTAGPAACPAARQSASEAARNTAMPMLRALGLLFRAARHRSAELRAIYATPEATADLLKHGRRPGLLLREAHLMAATAAAIFCGRLADAICAPPPTAGASVPI